MAKIRNCRKEPSNHTKTGCPLIETRRRNSAHLNRWGKMKYRKVTTGKKRANSRELKSMLRCYAFKTARHNVLFIRFAIVSRQGHFCKDASRFKAPDSVGSRRGQFRQPLSSTRPHPHLPPSFAHAAVAISPQRVIPPQRVEGRSEGGNTCRRLLRSLVAELLFKRATRACRGRDGTRFAAGSLHLPSIRLATKSENSQKFVRQGIAIDWPYGVFGCFGRLLCPAKFVPYFVT
jgi:hypothetical protein